ncbi:MAG: hypothetical protein QXR24_00200 [Thermosphaera sp.]
MKPLCLKTGDAEIQIFTQYPDKFIKALEDSFSRRYLPKFHVINECQSDVIIYWLYKPTGFTLLTKNLSSIRLPSIFIVEGDYPAPYVNESPVFFLLQVFAYASIKHDSILITDSVAVESNGKVILFLGYTHSGKSSVSALAYYLGARVLSTENTLIRISRPLKVVSGTTVLVYDPRIKELYDIKMVPDGSTKHGYEYIDLATRYPNMPLDLSIDRIFVIHSGFTCKGFSTSPIRGRKVRKTLWYFSTSLLNGVDYYDPRPLRDLLINDADRKLDDFFHIIEESYADRVHEVFGSIPEIVKNTLFQE